MKTSNELKKKTKPGTSLRSHRNSVAWLGFELTSFGALPALLSQLPKPYWVSLFLALLFTLSLSLAQSPGEDPCEPQLCSLIKLHRLLRA